MKIRRWLMPLLITLATVTAVKADEPGPNTDGASPNAAIGTKGDEDRQGSAAEPLRGSYQFLLEVAGVTPDQPSQERKRFAGVSPRRDSRGVRKAIDSAD